MIRIGEVTPYVIARLRDKERYHPENPADYQGDVGWPVEKDNEVVGYLCIGCFWCDGTYEQWARQNRAVAS